MATSDYFICPVCGTELPIKALSCPECGSDEETGWSQNTVYDGIDLPEFDTAFEASLGEHAKVRTGSIFEKRGFILVVSILAIIIFILVYLL